MFFIIKSFYSNLSPLGRKEYLKIFKFFIYSFIFFATKVFASPPGVVCNGLPGCEENLKIGDVDDSLKSKNFFNFLGELIKESINYVAVFAILALMFSGIMYLISIGDDEKVKKAKNAIIWSVVGVIISTGAWAIINMLNQFSIS